MMPVKFTFREAIKMAKAGLIIACDDGMNTLCSLDGCFLYHCETIEEFVETNKCPYDYEQETSTASVPIDEMLSDDLVWSVVSYTWSTEGMLPFVIHKNACPPLLEVQISQQFPKQYEEQRKQQEEHPKRGT